VEARTPAATGETTARDRRVLQAGWKEVWQGSWNSAWQRITGWEVTPEIVNSFFASEIIFAICSLEKSLGRTLFPCKCLNFNEPLQMYRRIL
jgi:hypothetical protein